MRSAARIEAIAVAAACFRSGSGMSPPASSRVQRGA